MKQSLLYDQLRKLPHPIISSDELSTRMQGSADSRYAKVKRMLAEKKLLRLRRGLYYLNENSDHFDKAHPFALAAFIYAPSYISLESALAYHQLIPEAVYTITSVTTKRRRHFSTPMGEYNYIHLPKNSFYTETQWVHEENKMPFFIAKPWKAICDYIYCYKKNWSSMSPLEDNLRIDLDELSQLELHDINTLSTYYNSQRVTQFLQNVSREFIA